MKPGDYLASRFMTSQIQGLQNQTSHGLAENQAIKFLMWLGIMILTAVQVFVIVAHYFGTLVRLRPQLKKPEDIYADAKIAEGRAKAAREKMAAEITANLKNASFNESGELKASEPGLH